MWWWYFSFFSQQYSGTLFRKNSKKDFLLSHSLGQFWRMYQDMFRLGVLSFVVWLVVQGKIRSRCDCLGASLFWKNRSFCFWISKAIAKILPPQKLLFYEWKGAEYTAHCGKFWDKSHFPVHWKNLFLRCWLFRTGEKGAQSFFR